VPRREQSSLRLFVAVYPPPAVAEHLIGHLSGMGLPPHRAVRPDQVHLTLHFIGDTRAADVSDVTESVRRAAAGLPPIALRVTGLVALPEKPPTRLVAAVCDPDPKLQEIHRRLITRLARKPREPERFMPHLTLCRFTGHGPAIDQRFSAAEVQSVLRPSGAAHFTLKRVPLAG
jgi:2'-5' RNA ligase